MERAIDHELREAKVESVLWGRDWDIARVSLDCLWKASEHVSPSGCPVPNGQCTNGTKGFDFQLISLRRHQEVTFCSSSTSTPSDFTQL
jgi:hypothetical protein